MECNVKCIYSNGMQCAMHIFIWNAMRNAYIWMKCNVQCIHSYGMQSAKYTFGWNGKWCKTLQSKPRSWDARNAKSPFTEMRNSFQCAVCISKMIAQIFQCSNVSMHRCSNVSMHRCSNVLMFQCSNVPMHRCSNAQMFQCSNAQMFQSWMVERCGIYKPASE